MPTTATADFICSKCKKGYAWYADFAGKVARCTCGAVIQFPLTDPKPKDPLAIPYLPRNLDEQTGHTGLAPMELPRDDQDPRILAEQRALGEFYEEAIPVDPVRDLHVPFALLAIGVLLLSWQIADLVEGKSAAFSNGFVIGYVIGKALELSLSLLGVYAAGKLMGVYFGKAKVAFFKLSALHIAPSAIGVMIASAMGDEAIGQVVGTGAFILLYWGLFNFVFRIKAWQTLVCVACILLVKVLAVMVIVGAVLSMFVARGMH
jgi:hypothetical protein